MLACQRSLFDIPDDIAYLNCAFLSPLMKNVAQAGARAIQDKVQPWGTTAEDFFTESEATRALFAQLINADVDGVAIVPAVSYGIAVAAANLPVSAGQEILVLDEQFPSNVYSWQRLAQKQDGTLRTVEKPPHSPLGRDWTPAILDAISEKTAIVALPNCHWTDGALIDLVAVSAMAKSVGAALVLDLAQSAGALPINIAEIAPDFLVAPTYKWLMGPYALGFLYVAPKWRTGHPLEENWILRKNSEDFAGLVDYEDEYQPGARRFDMGERANFQLMPMAKRALEQLLEWGVENIAESLRVKTDFIAARANALGLETGNRDLHAPHYLGIRFPGGMPDTLLQQLRAQNVFVSLRGTSMRVTPHLYNNDEDIDRLFAALENCL